jgi:poly-gamma-glutamate capsule biosynthesis protein CapA/YwtB (metallophosphatase superfamily)
MSDPAPMRAERATLAFLGDLMFGRLVSQRLRLHDPEWFWGDVIGLLRGADAVFANLECAITTSAQQWRRTPKAFHFRAEPACVDVLKAGNVRFVSLANNHALDFETGGLMETIAYLDAAGIAHAGAGSGDAAAAAPAFVRAGALNVAVFAVTDNMPEAAATPQAPGVCYVEAEAGDDSPGEDAIAGVRARGADLVTVSAHLGPNMTARPSPALRGYKQRLIARGVDLVHGHSAHVIQGLERVRGGLIMHDAGDFLDDYAVDSRLRNDLSFIFFVEADRHAMRRVRLVPVRLRLAQTNLASPDEADWICSRMQELSRPFGVELERSEEGLRLDFPNEAPT